MALNLDLACQKALDRAKRALPDGASLDVPVMLAALYHECGLASRWPEFVSYIPVPAEQGAKNGTVNVAPPLKAVLAPFSVSGNLLTPEVLFEALIGSSAGQDALHAAGMAAVPPIVAPAPPQPSAPLRPMGWRDSAERQIVIKDLEPFGRVLTTSELPSRGAAEMAEPLQALCRILSKMGRKNAIIVGAPGTGKSALIRELSRRIFGRATSLPAALHDMDLFELSPVMLRSGATYAGQYEERVKKLLELLRADPKIILFVDEIHSLFQSGLHQRGPFTDANEAFKQALDRREITVLGTTTLAEYRALIKPDHALDRRFSVLHLQPPTRSATVSILKTRRPRIEEHYTPLKIPDEILDKAVELSDKFYTGRYQPDKSIQLIDEVCACWITETKQTAELTEDHLFQALEGMTGQKLARRRQLTQLDVFGQLQAHIVGQDDVMETLAEKVVAGLSDWGKGGGTRGVFLFAGPTGVGKTETAVVLAQVLGAGRDALVRIDCNQLQGSGTGQDANSLIWRLVGTPAGYVGYVRGEGGLLGKVRDVPECVLLFDEFEKADPAVGRLILRILDEGRAEDAQGELLDFQRCFVVFTTNAGVSHRRRRLGLPLPGTVDVDEEEPIVSDDDLREDLLATGLGPEFLARIQHWLTFKSLTPNAIRVLVGRQLAEIEKECALRNLKLTWEQKLVDHLIRKWQRRFGVRHLRTILNNRLREQLALADCHHELEGVTAVHMELISAGGASMAGFATRQLRESTLVIQLA